MSKLFQDVAAIANSPNVNAGAGITVAVLDSGVVRSPVLPDSRVVCLDHLGQPSATTSGPHGTMCAGLIAGESVVGVGIAIYRTLAG